MRAVERWTDFYKHESCGKCTPVPRGHLVAAPRSWSGSSTAQGKEDDIDKLVDICDNILGRVVLRAR